MRRGTQWLSRGWSATAQAGGLWLTSRLALMGFVLLAAWTGDFRGKRSGYGLQWAIDRFWGADTNHYVRIAEQGYPKGSCCDQAFLPGYPLAIRAVSPITGGDYRLAALLVTLVFGVIMAMLLWQLASDQVASDQQDDASGPLRALTYLMVAAYGVFFVVGYAETMFLAVAIGAWLAGRRRHWWVAGLLGAAACSIRINGLFLMAALALMYLLQIWRAAPDGSGWRPRLRLDVLSFLFPVAALIAVGAVLHHSTGSWNAWQEAEHRGWDRRTAWPWDGLADGFREITTQNGPHILLASLAAFLTVVLGIVLTGVFAALRRWPEALFMLLNALALVCSTTFVSAPRYGLSWFPVYILVAELTGRARWRWLHPVLVMASLTLMATVALLFSHQSWVA